MNQNQSHLVYAKFRSRFLCRKIVLIAAHYRHVSGCRYNYLLFCPRYRPQGISTIAVIADSTKPVTIVSGLPRSGTSMMMQMLAAGGLPVMTDNVRAADDDNLEGYYELESVKQLQRDGSWLAEAPGKAVKIIYRLLEYLPSDYRYQVLFMERPLDQVIASQQLMLQRRATEGATVSSDQLRSIFSSELRRVKTWLAAQENFRWLEVPYAMVLESSQTESQRICDFLELPLDVTAMAARVNRKLHRQQG